MTEQQDNPKSSLIQQYEQQALEALRAWYQESHPTIEQASARASFIARAIVQKLTSTQALHVLEERKDWFQREPPSIFESDKQGRITIGEILCRLLIEHLEQTIQMQGIAAVHGKTNEGGLCYGVIVWRPSFPEETHEE